MKFTKFTAILLALAMLAGCSEKKKPESSSEIISEPVSEETTAQPEYRTYSYEDFKEINVSLNITDSPPPVTLKSYDIPYDRFGARVPPCKASENAWDYVPNADYFDESRANGLMSEEEYQDAYNDIMRQCKTASYGMIQGMSIDGNMLYIGINYDISCTGDHEYSIFRCNIDTDEYEEIYRYSSLDDEKGDVPSYFNFVIDNIIYYFDAKLDDNDNLISCSLIGYDIDTHEKKTVYESDTGFMPEKLNGKIISLMSEKQLDEDTVNDTYSILDLESGNITELFSSERNISSSFSAKVYFNGITSYLKKPENSRKLDVVSDNFTLSTNVSSAELLYASDEKVTLVTKGEVSILHTYDFTKMEHYVTDISKISGTYTSYNGDVIIGKGRLVNSDSPVYYLISELGIAMKITDQTMRNQIKSENGIVFFTTLKEAEIQTDGMTGYSLTPKTICILKEK